MFYIYIESQNFDWIIRLRVKVDNWLLPGAMESFNERWIIQRRPTLPMGFHTIPAITDPTIPIISSSDILLHPFPNGSFLSRRCVLNFAGGKTTFLFDCQFEE